MEWRKTGKARTLDEFVLENTGKTIPQLLEIKSEYHIQRFSQVVRILQEAKAKNIKVSLVADYDDDGVQSVLIMAYLLSIFQIAFEVIMPKRHSEGYGLSIKIVERIQPGNLLITIDNGIKAVEAVQLAKEKGMKVIILDHHQAGKTLPDADVIIDPEAVGEADYIHYCGAGIAFKLAEYILGPNHPYIPYLASFAAIGTIGDCVELTGDNRRIVMQGLKCIKTGYMTPGLNMLLKNSKITESSTATDIAFNVVPALNAPGRLYDDGAKISVAALYGNAVTNEEQERKQKQIKQLLEINKKRKTLVENYMKQIDLTSVIEKNPRSVFLYHPEMPLGIIGIIAGNITEATKRPSFIFSDDEYTGMVKGSVRSCSNDYSIIKIIEKAEHLLEDCGGHDKAAGITIRKENLKVFEEFINNKLPDVIYEEFLPYDLEVTENSFLSEAEKVLKLEPCGEGNPAPVVRIKAGLVKNKDGGFYRLLGDDKNHVKFTCNGFDAVAFYQADKVKDIKNASAIDMIGRVSENIYENRKGEKIRNLQVIVDDFKVF